MHVNVFSTEKVEFSNIVEAAEPMYMMCGNSKQGEASQFDQQCQVCRLDG